MHTLLYPCEHLYLYPLKVLFENASVLPDSLVIGQHDTAKSRFEINHVHNSACRMYMGSELTWPGFTAHKHLAISVIPFVSRPLMLSAAYSPKDTTVPSITDIFVFRLKTSEVPEPS